MKPEEKETLIKRLIVNYMKYLKSNRDSFLARIYGIYTVTKTGSAPVHLLVMANVCQVSSSQNVTAIYDLKGSLYKRIVYLKESLGKRDYTLKDLNFLKEYKNPLAGLHFSQIIQILHVLKEDSNFCASQNLMDYSLLICIEDLSRS